jgi:hypothetical protein
VITHQSTWALPISNTLAYYHTQESHPRQYWWDLNTRYGDNPRFQDSLRLEKE